MRKINTNKPLQIAIDGPAGSGKGTLALNLARNLNAVHVYTGGMYRALALYCLRHKIDVHDENSVVKALEYANIDLTTNEDATTNVILNEENITDEITKVEVSNNVPIVSKYQQVRMGMVKKQQEIASNHRVIIEGRDIANVVLPNADLKIFLIADADIRAKRRLTQLKEKNPNITFDEVKNDLVERDRKDEQRDVSPLKTSEDSFIIDTTDDKVEDTVRKVMDELRKRGLL